MTRWTSRLLGIAALTLSLVATPAQGAGFPDFDDKREQILFGRVRSGDAIVPGTADTLGRFEQSSGRLARAADQEEPSAFWLTKGDNAAIADGMVRFRAVLGKRPDFGLMVRGHAQAGWASICGYEVTFDKKNKVQLLRWDRGVAKPLGDAEKLSGVSANSTVEVVVYVIGPQIVATIYAGKSLKHLATLAAHDTAYASGTVGYRVGVKQEGGGLELAAVMDTSRSARSGIGQRVPYGKLYGPARHKDATPFGNWRYAYLPKDQLASVPKALKKRPGEFTPKSGPTQALLAISPVEAEQLRRSDVDVIRIDGMAGWGWFDAAYREHRERPPVPTRRGFALDRSYKNGAMVEAILRGYHDKYPDITQLVELGRTHDKRPIWALKISDNPTAKEDEPAVLFDATHHASELLSTEFGLDVVAGLLEDYGRVKKVTGWVDGMEIFCVPMVNPDGNLAFLEKSMWTIRKNGLDGDGDGFVDPFEGVDLNRNYPFGWGDDEGSDSWWVSQQYRGPSPASEPETKAMMALANEHHFAASLSFHTIGRAIFVPYTVDHSSSPKPNVAWSIAEELVAAAPMQRNDKPYVVRPNGYPVAGSDQDWLMHEHGTVALLLEGAYHNPELSIRTEAVANTRPVWQTLLNRVASGPRISGHVRDPSGKPIVATVTIEQIELNAGERWTSRPRDGRFDRLLAKGGRYTVRAQASGYAAVEQDVRVGSRPVEIDLTMSRG